MPEICVFLGIKVTVHWRDHPPPHIHVDTGSHLASVRISDGTILAGKLPPKLLRLVQDWIVERQPEIEAAFSDAANMVSPRKVAPPEGMF